MTNKSIFVPDLLSEVVKVEFKGDLVKDIDLFNVYKCN
jgi:hypothetical protein